MDELSNSMIPDDPIVEKVLAGLEEKAKTEFHLYWNIDRKTGEFLYRLITSGNARRIVEVGASNGYSTLWLARAARDVGGSVISFEFDHQKLGEWAVNLKRARLMRYVTIIPDDANKRLPDLEGPIDCLFLDARKIDYLKQLQSVEHLLSSGALVIADNVVSHKDALKEYLAYVTMEHDYRTELFTLGQGVAVSTYTKL